MFWESWPHRTYCDCIEEMRKLTSQLSIWNIVKYRYIIKLLIEELQTYGNRMEAGLSYEKDLRELHDKKKSLLKDIEKQEKKLRKLQELSNEDNRDKHISDWVKELDDDS